MKFMRALTFIFVAAVGFPAIAEDKKDVKFDAEKLLGDWNVTGGKKMGKEIGDEGKKGSYGITKDKITLKEDGKEMFVFGYTIDAKTSPVNIELEILTSAIEGLKGLKAKGIVELKDGELKLCYDGMGGDRPKKFDDEKASSFVLKKKEAKKDK
jgi:uncharacterized protein (TIGR03067 family)